MTSPDHLRLVRATPRRELKPIRVRISARIGREPHSQTREFRLSEAELHELASVAGRLEARP